MILICYADFLKDLMPTVDEMKVKTAIVQDLHDGEVQLRTLQIVAELAVHGGRIFLRTGC